MKISVIASTKVGEIPQKQEFDNLGGHCAGVCYMKNDFDSILAEAQEKTDRRILQTKEGGHHSVYDHAKITFNFENIPKALAMILNNEKVFDTSEKSARYTKMVLKDDEQKMFDKWLSIYKDLISEAYAKDYPQIFNPNKIEKLAQENARYLISVFTPTSMIYTCSYRQMNYLYGFMQDVILNGGNSNKFYEGVLPAMADFCGALEKTGLIDSSLVKNGKNRELSLFRTKQFIAPEYFGEVYSTNYLGSLSQLAQAQRHRTLNYQITLLDEPKFYFPPIIRKSESLQKQWLTDCQKQADFFPEGLLVNINERGTYENFILKLKERKCTFAQLEINQQCTDTLNRYVAGLKNNGFFELQDDLKKYNRGARCTFPDYKCNAPCGFKEGICETREI